MEGATGRERSAAIAAAIACITLVGIGLSLSVPLLSLEMERMGVSKVWIGANTAVAGLASIVVVPFVPRLAARVGVLPMLVAAVLTLTLVLPLFKVFPSFPLWFPLRFVFAASLGVLFVLSEYWINAAAPPARRGFVMGIYATVLSLGFVIGPALLSLVGTSGWPPYLIGAVLFLVGLVPLMAARGVSPAIERGGRRTILSFLLAAPAATLAALVFGMVETGCFALLPIYGLANGFDPEGAAFLVGVLSIGSVVLQVPIGVLSDRADRRLVLLGIAALGLAGALLIPVAMQRTALLYPLLVVWGGVVGGLYTVGLAHLGARFHGAELATANAAFVVLYNVGLVAGPPVVGLFMDASRDGFAMRQPCFSPPISRSS
ncbi:MFS transporter [Salinarimonas soli]|uniref:MFS transporter n=1 Tax=Salinarimonas soli TaxID=1638099 RepID=A0A5B2VZ55_9HYPH|nr:MFS transporter [Salinarimonas soli]KAA2243958.1 MFS transporter [Salinarimonas soli]